MREFDTLRQALTGPAIIALCDAPWSPIYILICFVIHPLIGALVLVGVVLLAAVAVRNNAATREPLQSASEAAARAYASQAPSPSASDWRVSLRNLLVVT